MNISNKEVIAKLMEYFSTQDPQAVARLLANCMVDFNRIDTMSHLHPDEKRCLLIRIKANAESLRKFIKDGPSGNLRMGSLENE